MFKNNVFVNWKCWFGHNWAAWVHRTTECADERFCKWCQLVEQKKNHRFGSWVIEKAHTNHLDEKGSLIYVSSHTIQVKTCQDCNYHIWEKY